MRGALLVLCFTYSFVALAQMRVRFVDESGMVPVEALQVQATSETERQVVLSNADGYAEIELKCPFLIQTAAFILQRI